MNFAWYWPYFWINPHYSQTRLSGILSIVQWKVSHTVWPSTSRWLWLLSESPNLQPPHHTTHLCQLLLMVDDSCAIEDYYNLLLSPKHFWTSLLSGHPHGSVWCCESCSLCGEQEIESCCLPAMQKRVQISLCASSKCSTLKVRVLSSWYCSLHWSISTVRANLRTLVLWL